MPRLTHILILIVLTSVVFSLSNELFNGSLKSKENLSGELKSPADSLYLWNIGNEPPFKYRLIHRSIVSSSYKIISKQDNNNEVFFLTYKTISFVLQLITILIFYIFLVKIGVSQYALVGSIVFAILPPFLLAYNVPVHTREDILAYSLLILGLIFIINKHPFLLTLTVIVGVLTRETLLILPFVNLFFNKQQNINLRLFISLLAFALFCGVRWSLGSEAYNYWEGFYWNKNNLIQVIGFGFITFGFLWIPLFINFKKNMKQNSKIQLIQKSSLPVFLLIVVTTFLGGIFNEIRLLYLLSPWVIVLSIDYYHTHSNRIHLILKSKRYSIYCVIVIVTTLIPTILAINNLNDFVKPSQYEIPYNLWIVVGTIQVCIGLSSLPFFIERFQKKIMHN